MPKLRLNLDDLAVDTFQTAEHGDALRGTVNAHAATLKTLCENVRTVNTEMTCCPCTPMV